jgi:hypothetical protein
MPTWPFLFKPSRFYPIGYTAATMLPFCQKVRIEFKVYSTYRTILWLIRFHSPLLSESRLISFPFLNEMFYFRKL